MTQSELDILVTEWWFVALVAIVFAYFALRRGLTIGLYMLIGTVVGIVFADRIAKFLKPWINFAYQTIMAIVRQRVFSPEELFKAAAQQPQLITQDNQLVWLGSIVFALLIVTGFLIGRKRKAKAKPPRAATQVLAILTGAVNGYLVAYFLFPRHITAQKTIITVPNVNVKSLLQVQLSLPILITVLVLITLGVLGTREGKAKGK
jgi:hypothetical protein